MVNRYYSTTAAQAQLTSSLSSSATTINIDTTTGWPSSFPFTLIIDPGTSSEEVVECTGVAGLSATVIRGVDGSTGLAHTVGAKVQHGVSARDFAEPQAHIAASTGVHGLAGGVAVVGTSTTQTLTNKTVDGGSNTLTNIGDASVPGWNTHKSSVDVHHEIDPHDVNSNALLIKALAGQVADLEVWQDSTAAVLGYMGPDGTFGAGGGGAADNARFRVCGPTRVGDVASKATVNVKASSTTKPIFRVDGTGQAAGGDLVSLLASNGTSTLTVDKDANLSVPGTFAATSGASTLQSLTVNNNAAVTGNLTVSGNLHGALTSCTSTARPGSPSTGDLILETDKGRIRYWDGAHWIFVAGKTPSVKCARLSAQTITNFTATVMTWPSTDVYDTDSMHDTAVNNSRITFSEVGLWLVSFQIVWAGNNGADREAWIRMNGAGDRLGWVTIPPIGTLSTVDTSSAIIRVNAITDYVECLVFQATGANLDVNGDSQNHFSAHYLGAF